AEFAAANGQRASDIVAIADEDDGSSLQAAGHFLHGEQIPKSLARVIIIGQAVNDWASGVCSERFNGGVTESPQNNCINVFAYHPGKIRHRLTRAEPGFTSGKEDAGAAELGNRGLETHARPQ